MKTNTILKKFLFFGLILINTNVFSQDPNFYIYLCFGQSNMEGQGPIESVDLNVDSRFKVMEAVNCSNLGRTKGEWYTAVPPLCRCSSGLSPTDYFGRTMVEYLPENIKVGVINVSVAGCKIELFDKDSYQLYVSSITEDWLINIINEYDGNPYQYLVDVAKLAQQDGIIKGILLHQGESNTGDTQWPSKVKKIYDDLMTDLELNPDSVPLLAGQVVDAEQGGVCASMNSIIGELPLTLPNSYVVSSSGCTDQEDNLHFDSEGYRKLGSRYALKMLSIYGYDVEDVLMPTNSQTLYFEPECAAIGGNWNIVSDTSASNGIFVTPKDTLKSTNEPPAGAENFIQFPFNVEVSTYFDFFARIYCPDSNSDSFWFQMDDGEFISRANLRNREWKWVRFYTYQLEKGDHVLTIAYNENGAKLDKINITNYTSQPTDLGLTANNLCELTVGVNLLKGNLGYTLEQNYPNPFNGKTSISFEVPKDSHVSLKIYSILGKEVAELAGEKFVQGKHIIEFDPENIGNGIYFYTMKTDDFSITRKMILQDN